MLMNKSMRPLGGMGFSAINSEHMSGQYSLGLTIQGYRSKKLTRLLHMSGQIMSYDNLLKADTSLAQKTLQTMDKDTGTVLTA